MDKSKPPPRRNEFLMSKYVVIQQIEDEELLPLDGVHGPFDSYGDAEGYGDSMGWLFAIREIQEPVKPKPKRVGRGKFTLA